MSGALLLALGYSLILPLYSAGVLVPIERIPNYPERDPIAIVTWQLVRMIALNGGWLLFGLGLALHARLFGTLDAPRHPAS